MTGQARTQTLDGGRRGREWHMTDVMLLVAVLALALAWLRSAFEALFGPFQSLRAAGPVPPWGAAPNVLVVRLANLADATLPFLAVATLGLVALRLRPPRPALGRLARQPGLLACGVASLFLIAPVGGALTWVIFQGLLRGPGVLGQATSQAVAQVYDAMSDWGYLIGFAVAVAWIVLGVILRCRSEPDAYDRAGRALGWAWVVIAPVAMALRLVFLLDLLS
jgi:hypothetical protein